MSVQQRFVNVKTSARRWGSLQGIAPRTLCSGQRGAHPA